MKITINKVLISLAVLMMLISIAPQNDIFTLLGGISKVEAATVKYATTANLNMRSGASTKHKVLTVIPKGKQVTLISKHGTWYKISYASKTGYVSSQFLKQVNDDHAKTIRIKSTNN